MYDSITNKSKFKNKEENNFKSNYAKYVLVPEGLIYFLMDKFKMIYKVADEIFVTTVSLEMKIHLSLLDKITPTKETVSYTHLTLPTTPYV